MTHDIEWWKRRAIRRYQEAQKLTARLEAVRDALAKHADCWPDCPCADLATDIRTALGDGR